MTEIKHLTKDQLEAGLDDIRRSPKDKGVLQMIVRRPQTEQREELLEGELDLVDGLVGDNWRTRGSSLTEDGSAHPEMQVTLMNSRVIDLLAQEKSRWKLAGDQLFVDLDLSIENLPPGTHLALGSAVIEVTPAPHTGCSQFMERFGVDAMKFVNSAQGRELRLRGMNGKVIQPGAFKVGDVVKKVL